MGFGSYDESEQENQEIDTEEMENDQDDLRGDAEHDGEVDFEMEDTESAIDKLHQITGEEEEEEEE